jgi:Rps23 Pro-64 3,4-dihydroxylase Tpa1-like proline 4-hydroxylase
MNQNWDDDWGGYFAYKDNNEIKCIKPEFNKLTYIEPPIQHTVFNTSSLAPIREAILIFGK